MMGIRDEIAEIYCHGSYGCSLEELKSDPYGEYDKGVSFKFADKILTLIESKLPEGMTLEEAVEKLRGKG